MLRGNLKCMCKYWVICLSVLHQIECFSQGQVRSTVHPSMSFLIFVTWSSCMLLRMSQWTLLLDFSTHTHTHAHTHTHTFTKYELLLQVLCKSASYFVAVFYCVLWHRTFDSGCPGVIGVIVTLTSTGMQVAKTPSTRLIVSSRPHTCVPF